MARKTKKEAMETRARLLESALDIMSRKSFHSVTMSEIAERIGLSKGAIYWHFRNKDDILAQLVESLFAEASERLWSGGLPPENVDDIHKYYRNKMKNSIRGERFHKINTLIRRRQEWPPETQKTISAFIQNKLTDERNMLERAFKKHHLEEGGEEEISIEELSFVITAVFQGLFVLHLNDEYGFDFVKHTDFILDSLIKNGLGPKSSDRDRGQRKS